MARLSLRLSKEEISEQKKWREWKYGSPWLSRGDKELAWRYKNSVPLELGYKEAREWLREKAEEKK